MSDGISPDLCVFLKGEIVFFDHVDWRVMRSRQLDILRHEIGHILGLQHRSDRDSLMYSDTARGQEWMAVDVFHSRLAYQLGPCATRGTLPN